MSTTTELKPCPFCGSNRTHAKTMITGACVACETCGVHTAAIHKTWEEAIAAWNRRSAAHGEPSKGDSIKSYHIGEPQPFPMDAAMSILKSGLERARQAGSAEQVSEKPPFFAHPALEWNRAQSEPPIKIGMEYHVAKEIMRLCGAALQHTAPAPSKAGEWTEERIARLVDSMCVTWRHDFGLDKPEPSGNWYDSIQAGMTEQERDALRRDMRQLVEHHFLPLLTSAPAQAAQSEDQG